MSKINSSENPVAQSRTAGWIIGTVSFLVILLVTILLVVPRQVTSGQVDVSNLPLLNAILNGTSGLMLVVGFFFIRRRLVTYHRFSMLAAFSLSALFLVSYVIYHTFAGSTSFTGQGWIRPVYFIILISHIILAVLVLPLALTTLYQAWRGIFNKHRRVARWTLPIWLYVSVTGVLVYLMLHGFSG